MNEIIPPKLKCEKCKSMEGVADFRTGGVIKVFCQKHAEQYEKEKALPRL